jgi:activator of HSP90 ATPase
VCQRKGKVISLFDLALVLTFEGSSNADGDKVSGEIKIPEVAYDSEESDYVFNVSSIKDDAVRDLVKKSIVPQLRTALFQFGKDLIREHGSDIQHSLDEVKSSFTRENTIKSQADIAALDAKPKSSTSASSSASATSNKDAQAASATGNVPKYNTEPLVKTEVTFRAPASEIIQTLLDPERVSAWSRSTAIIKPEVGFQYTLFGGNISGKITEITTSMIQMTWRLREWKEGHSANLKLEVTEGPEDSAVKVSWTGIPLGEAETVLNNFNEYYVKPIKVTFGYGVIL